MSKKKQISSTDTYIERINGKIKSVKPSYDPITPRSNDNLEKWKENWKNYNLELHAKMFQEKINLNWIEFCSRFYLCESLYDSIKGKQFSSPKEKRSILEKLRCSNITINYFQEADPQDIEKLTSCLMEKDNQCITRNYRLIDHNKSRYLTATFLSKNISDIQGSRTKF
ncbi:7645_t:CDS:2 [Racocetra fulgida]|uniref:7645_t:CDS:1 n=1 Tax=Racocetra fulgida TaxID=60492 RepID=A0A9N9D924_9GLOM|nr:7645_t:CDS:2 [Racocetra fulgida]